MQYNTTLQLMDSFYNSSQAGEDVEKVNNLVLEVGYNLRVQRPLLKYISFVELFMYHYYHSILYYNVLYIPLIELRIKPTSYSLL